MLPMLFMLPEEVTERSFLGDPINEVANSTDSTAIDKHFSRTILSRLIAQILGCRTILISSEVGEFNMAPTARYY